MLLNLTHVASFVVLAEELNFGKAAQRLYVTQPALSRQIRLIEESLGVELFTRSRREVRLTRSGSALLVDARTLLASARSFESLAGQSSTSPGPIAVGVSAGLAERIRSAGVAFQKRFPKTNLIYQEMSSTAQNIALRKCEIEVGFLRSPVNPSYILSEPLFREQLVVVLAKSHPLANARKITLSQVAEEILFLRPHKSGAGLHDKVYSLYRNAGIKPRVVHTSLSPQFVGDAHIATGEGIYILPERIILTNEELVTVRLDEPNADREVHIAWRKGEKSRQTLEFIEVTRATLKHRRRTQS